MERFGSSEVLGTCRNGDDIGFAKCCRLVDRSDMGDPGLTPYISKILHVAEAETAAELGEGDGECTVIVAAMSNRGALAGVSVVLCAGGSSVSGVNGGEFVVGEGRARNMFPCVQSMDIRLRSMGKSRFEGSIIDTSENRCSSKSPSSSSATLFHSVPAGEVDLGISLCLLVNGLTVNSNPLPSGSDGRHPGEIPSSSISSRNHSLSLFCPCFSSSPLPLLPLLSDEPREAE